MNRFSRLNARTMILCVLVMSSFIISSLHVNGQNRSYEAWVDNHQIDNTDGSAFSQDSRVTFSGKWKMTDAYEADANNVKDVNESKAVKADLTEKVQFEYEFTDTRLTILIHGQPVYMYYYTKDTQGKFSIDEPYSDAFGLMRGLELVEVNDANLILRSYSPDSNERFIYQIFTRH